MIYSQILLHLNGLSNKELNELTLAIAREFMKREKSHETSNPHCTSSNDDGIDHAACLDPNCPNYIPF